MPSLPNPYVIVGVLLAMIGTFFYGTHVGSAETLAKAAKTEALVAAVREQAQQGAAEEIAKLQPKYTTIQQKTEVITREVPVYHECHNTPDVLSLLNSALSGGDGAESAGSGKLPGANAAH